MPAPSFGPNRRRRAGPRFLCAATALLLLLGAKRAEAQADLSPVLPNALLLVDTSGSMEFKTNGEAPICNPNLPDDTNEKTRWIDLVEVLTGTIKDYSCEALDRSSSSFVNEFKLGSIDPYDYKYPIPYHRPLGSGCGPAPGTQFGAGANPFIYPQTNPIKFHQYNWGASCASFSQPANDGILDSFRALIRFALMTFDTSTSAGTGYDGTSVNNATGVDGHWSYIVDGAIATGKPIDCLTAAPDQEVGARNAAAPPWEGRMINFGNPEDGVRAYLTKNDQIQQVLLATRPFGATPIAGMLEDAKSFLLDDKTVDPDPIPASPAPTGFKGDFGPYRDEYLKCQRSQVVILLTDGQPNMDLRPACEGPTETSPNECPFQTPETTAEALKAKGIITHVVGFALDEVNDGSGVKKCSDESLVCSGADASNNAALKACCTLKKIATAGGGSAQFASDRAALRSQIHGILSDKVNTTSRTQPTIAGGGNTAAGSARFFSGFSPGLPGAVDAPGRLWSAVLNRQRWVCEDTDNDGLKEPVRQEIEEDEGDKFIHNVSVAGPDNRLIYTYLGGSSDSDPLTPLASMRPNLGSEPSDGVGPYSARLKAAKTGAFVSQIPAAAMDVPASACTAAGVSAGNACRDFFLRWVLGAVGTSRCPTVGEDCKLIGDIFHSTPQAVDRPNSFLRDESYARFAYEQAARPVVLYTSTNDGFLHAFRVASNDPDEFDEPDKMVQNDAQSNELWAFIPPAVQPNLYLTYPYSHEFLLDGVPVISDVVAVPGVGDALPTVFERNATAARGGSNTWRTVLIQGFGAEHNGYFALDVTTPVPDTNAPADLTKGGPRLLWQLTADKDGTNLFGRGGATPAITTLYFDPTGGTSPREIPVAILPGGPGGTAKTIPAPARNFASSEIEDEYAPRTQVRDYTFDATNRGARSLSIVRLDTGEIIRTFRNPADAALVTNTSLKQRVTEVVGLDSPVTGQPVAYPGLVGAVADRIYVGDADGRFWRLDVSAARPAEWTMKLFFDLFPASLAGSGSGLDFDDGQPVMTPPVISVDDVGNVTINVATGDQDQLGSASTLRNFVYSLTEKLSDDHKTVAPKLNWYKELTEGTRAYGPLVLFNRNLYFATVKPQIAGTPCSSAVSRVWGMDYIVPNGATPGDPDPDRTNGGDPAPGFPDQFIEQSGSAIVSGVSLVQQPSCFTLDDEAVGDVFLGLGGQRRVGQVRTGKFQLIMHMGDAQQNVDDTQAQLKTGTIDLPTPDLMSQIASWASIIE